MATSFLQSITNALGGSAKGTTPPQGQSNEGSQSADSQVYDSAGNPVQTKAGNQSGTSGNLPSSGPAFSNVDPAAVNQNQNQAQNQSIEDLLFAAPAEGTTKVPAQVQQPANQNQQQEAELAPGLTARQLIQNLGNVNFMGAIPQETVQAALGGDANAFQQVISSVAQLSSALAVQQSIAASKSLMDSKFSEFDSSLNSRIGESKYSDILTDPRFSNPFIKPMAENLITKLRERDPSITPDQIKQTLPNLIQYAMSKASLGQQDQPNQGIQSTPGTKTQQVPKEINYDELF